MQIIYSNIYTKKKCASKTNEYCALLTTMYLFIFFVSFILPVFNMQKMKIIRVAISINSESVMLSMLCNCSIFYIKTGIKQVEWRILFKFRIWTNLYRFMNDYRCKIMHELVHYIPIFKF